MALTATETLEHLIWAKPLSRQKEIALAVANAVGVAGSAAAGIGGTGYAAMNHEQFFGSHPTDAMWNLMGLMTIIYGSAYTAKFFLENAKELGKKAEPAPTFFEGRYTREPSLYVAKNGKKVTPVDSYPELENASGTVLLSDLWIEDVKRWVEKDRVFQKPTHIVHVKTRWRGERIEVRRRSEKYAAIAWHKFHYVTGDVKYGHIEAVDW